MVKNNSRSFLGQAMLFFLLLAFSNPLSSYAQNITKGLVGYYTFCDCTAKDLSGLNRNGVVVGRPQCIPGIRDRGLLLNQSIGTNGCGQPGGEYVQLPGFEPVWSAGFTVCAWVRFDEIKNFERIIDFSNGTGEGGGTPVWFGREGNSNNLTLESWINANGNQARSTGRLTALNAVTNGSIEFYCATISGDTMRIYVNGKLVAQKRGNPIADVPRVNNYIGRSAWCANDPDFKGFMDEVRIYNRALNAAEMQSLYQYTNIKDFTVNRNCNNTQTDFEVEHAYDVDSLKWNFGDEASGNLNRGSGLKAAHTFSSFGTYNVKLIVYKPCVNDTIIKTVNIAPANGFLGKDVELCPGKKLVLQFKGDDGTYLWQNGSTADSFVVNEPGMYWLQAGLYNCRYSDSIIVTSARRFAAISAVVCSGQSYLGYNSTGIYRDTFLLLNGCDSIRTLQLTVQDKMIKSFSVQLCPGQSYTLPWGQMVATPGIYRDTSRNSNGCDSLVREVNVSAITVKVNRSEVVKCANQPYTLPWGTAVNTAGMYSDTIKSRLGCDSLVRMIRVVIGQAPMVSVTKSNNIDCMLGSTKLIASGGVAYKWLPAASLSNAFISNPVASPAATTWYKVTVNDANGCTAEDSIEVKVNFSNAGNSHLVPSAFSPNGDGRNDCFGVPFWGAVNHFSMSLYNRWGQRVFFTVNSTDCWDGKVAGKEATGGAYVYFIMAETPCGAVKRSGTFVLIR